MSEMMSHFWVHD